MVVHIYIYISYITTFIPSSVIVDPSVWKTLPNICLHMYELPAVSCPSCNHPYFLLVPRRLVVFLSIISPIIFPSTWYSSTPSLWYRDSSHLVITYTFFTHSHNVNHNNTFINSPISIFCLQRVNSSCCWDWNVIQVCLCFLKFGMQYNFVLFGYILLNLCVLYESHFQYYNFTHVTDINPHLVNI